MKINGSALLLRVARIVPKLPAWLTRAIFRAAGDGASLLRAGGVVQLERNLARVVPWANDAQLRRLARGGMRSYLRYYEEALRLPRVGPAALSARIRVVNETAVRQYLDDDQPLVLALGHCGNWDLAGAWSEQFLAPVLTVAEKLEPEELFESFLSFRRGLGMDIIPLASDGSTFRELLRRTPKSAAIVPLLADRDLSRHGVEVTLFGEPARVAAGPVLLALATGSPLLTAMIHYERLRGPRSQAAGTPWGIVITFSQPITQKPGEPRSEALPRMTQEWVNELAHGIAAHPQDWHMLQPVFVADLDAARLKAAQSVAT